MKKFYLLACVFLVLAIVAETIGKQYSATVAETAARRAANLSESDGSKDEADADSLLRVGARFSFIGNVLAGLGVVWGLVFFQWGADNKAPVFTKQHMLV